MTLGELNPDVNVPWIVYWTAPWIAAFGGLVCMAVGPAMIGGAFMLAGCCMVFTRLTGGK